MVIKYGFVGLSKERRMREIDLKKKKNYIVEALESLWQPIYIKIAQSMN